MQGPVLMHMPMAHTWPRVHERPQAPQFAASESSSDSQPFMFTPSQLPKPGLQDCSWHVPRAHAGCALANTHALPHAPQLLTSETSAAQVRVPSAAVQGI